MTFSAGLYKNKSMVPKNKCNKQQRVSYDDDDGGGVDVLMLHVNGVRFGFASRISLSVCTKTYE